MHADGEESGKNEIVKNVKSFPHEGAFHSIFIVVLYSHSMYNKLDFFSLSHFSDCEVNDVIELAKDEQLVDKLYAETLRALKLEDGKSGGQAK